MELFPDVLTLLDGQVDAPGQLFAKVRSSGSVNHLWPPGGAVAGVVMGICPWTGEGDGPERSLVR